MKLLLVLFTTSDVAGSPTRPVEVQRVDGTQLLSDP